MVLRYDYLFQLHSKVRSQRPNVVAVTGLWGRLNEINNLSGREDRITGRTFLDIFRYCLKHSTGKSFLSWLKQAKNAFPGLSALPVLLGTVKEGRCNV